MSACRCSERNRPAVLPEGSNDRPRQWFVLQRNESRSAFNGYRRQWSAYSYVACRVCGAQWRTKTKVSVFTASEYFPSRHEPRVSAYEDWLKQ